MGNKTLARILQDGLKELSENCSFQRKDKFNNIYNNVFVTDSWYRLITGLVDEIFKNQRSRVEGFSVEDMRNIIGGITFEFKREEVKAEEIEKRFRELINRPFEEFWVMRPIMGIVLRKENKVSLGPFIIFEKNEAMKYTENKFPLLLENDVNIWINDMERIKDYYLIGISVCAKTIRRAIEIADERFEAFESVIRFMQMDNKHYNVCILNNSNVMLKSAIAISPREYHSSSSLEGVYSNFELLGEKLNEGKFKDIWEMMGSYHKNIVSEWHNRIIMAIICVGHACKEINGVNKFLQYIFALEIILHNNGDGMITPSIANQIAETTSFIISNDLEERKQIFKDTKEIYSKRSATVHGGSNSVNTTLLIKARNISYYLIYGILNNEELMSLNNANELYEWTLNQRFG